MNIRPKELFEEFGIPVLGGKVAETAEEAVKIAEGLKAPYVIKAQVHSGGRGKAGGVKLVNTLEEAREASEKILGMTLITHQTGPEGKLVRKVLVTPAVEVKRSFT